MMLLLFLYFRALYCASFLHGKISSSQEYSSVTFIHMSQQNDFNSLLAFWCCLFVYWNIAECLCFRYLTFVWPQPNFMKLKHSAYYHKTFFRVWMASLLPFMLSYKGKNWRISSFHSLYITLVDLNHLLWNFYTMCITIKHRLSLNFGGIPFTVL